MGNHIFLFIILSVFVLCFFIQCTRNDAYSRIRCAKKNDLLYHLRDSVELHSMKMLLVFSSLNIDISLYSYLSNMNSFCIFDPVTEP
jgi:hypothetical protein